MSRKTLLIVTVVFLVLFTMKPRARLAPKDQKESLVGGLLFGKAGVM